MDGRKLLGAVKGRTPSPAIVISIIALVFAVGGGFAVAKKHHSDSKSDKKIANKQITKRAPGLSVAHAKTADTAAQAANADKLGGLASADFQQGKRFSVFLNEDGTQVVASSGNFDVVAVCDIDNSLASFGNEGTGLYIVQKGQDNGIGATADDDDEDFDVGDFVGFDFVDAGDAGDAINPNGAFVHVEGGGVDEGPFTGFSQDCWLSGSAAFG
jgi:hypothetical protein